ncbi:SEC-C domain-containing protein [Amycolatopsis sp. NPDC051106]|uniref:SEC-C domain-containing protein n=1 Tax=unclassified Amycolatopsis TaxID=2618356 RepID=UPI00341BD336
MRRAAIAREHGLDDEAAFAVLVIVTQYEKFTELRETDSLGDDVVAAGFSAAVSLLAEVAVAEAVLAEIPATAPESAVALVVFAESLEPMAPRAAKPALHWLRGQAHERLGDLAAAEAAYQAAESLDPKWSPALYALARFAGDRGDAGGLALLRRADFPSDDVLVELLERYQVELRADVGRNDPCWCGSGRKYKKCHLHRESLPLDERASWLYQKADLFLGDGPWRSAMLVAAEARAEFAADGSYALLDALDDPLTADVVLFEGGAFADFLAVPGRLAARG